MSKVLSAAEAQEQQARQQAALMQGATRAAQALAGTTCFLSTNSKTKLFAPIDKQKFMESSGNAKDGAFKRIKIRWTFLAFVSGEI